MFGIGVSELLVLTQLAILVVSLVRAVMGSRPKARRFLEVNGLTVRPGDEEWVRAALHRTYISRLAGGIVGCLLGAGTAARLGTGFAVGGAGIGLLTGTLLGIAVAQKRRSTTTDRSRSASLVARDPEDYRPPHATKITTGVAIVVLGYGTFALATVDGAIGVTGTLFASGFATLLAVPLGRWLQRRTTELQRTETDPDSLRVDDGLRASAVRGIHHATLGVLFCGLLILGYAASSTQTFVGITNGDRVLFRAPPMSRVTSIFTSQKPVGTNGYEETDRLRWTEPGGRTRSVVIHSPGPNVQMGDLATNPTLQGVGYWAAIIGLLGAILQMGRAAKAWRRPQNSPTTIGAAA